MTNIKRAIELLEELRDRCDGTEEITPSDIRSDVETILIYVREPEHDMDDLDWKPS